MSDHRVKVVENIEICSKCAEWSELEAPGIHIVDPSDCIYCNGLLWQIGKLVDKIIQDIGDFEFDSFLIGTKIEGSIRTFEEYLSENAGMKQEKSIKYLFNREIGTKLSLKTGKTIKFKKPDVNIIFNPEKESFSYEIKPLFIYGRYIKRVRNISQTRWVCSKCNGNGCEECNFVGKKYLTSVEELIAEPCREIAKGSDAVLHGAGREDVDARMLGSGRPFVVEIKEPKIRNPDLKMLEELINSDFRVKVTDLKLVGDDAVKLIKSHPFRKKYRAKIVFEREISPERLKKALDDLRSRVILQRTPKRVEHRRADLLRKKRTHEIQLLLHRGDLAVVEIESDAGLYIKELVSGDEGRTKPSLSELTGVNAKVEKLDVIGVFE